MSHMGIDKNDYLYHYTSLESLALILTNKTLCFNSLMNVDDAEEVETADFGNAGKYRYVSCWTDDPNESVALWKLYTPDMHGVRIGLRRMPFKKYQYKKGEYNFDSDTTSFVNYEKLFIEDRGMILGIEPQLVKVEYKREESYIHPSIIKHSIEDGKEWLTYAIGELGKYKRDIWEFQHEWRYILTILPVGMRSLYAEPILMMKNTFEAMKNNRAVPAYDRYFFEIDDTAIQFADILFGPKMNEAEKILAKALLRECGIGDNWRESSLRIR